MASVAVSYRIELVEGSFFEAVPQEGDCYILKHILHDWDDRACASILKNCRRSIGDAGRLLVIESVIRPGNEPHFGKLLDIEMLAVTEGGRERTEQEYAEMFEKDGFRLTRIVDTLAAPSVIEAEPA